MILMLPVNSKLTFVLLTFNTDQSSLYRMKINNLSGASLLFIGAAVGYAIDGQFMTGRNTPGAYTTPTLGRAKFQVDELKSIVRCDGDAEAVHKRLDLVSAVNKRGIRIQTMAGDQEVDSLDTDAVDPPVVDADKYGSLLAERATAPEPDPSLDGLPDVA